MGRTFLRKLTHKKITVAALVVLGALLLIAFVGPLVYPHSPYSTMTHRLMEPPSVEHWLGTDYAGRDLLARFIHGARLSIGIGLLSAVLGGTAGTCIGLLAGYHGGRVDGLLSRFIELLMAIPGLLLAILVVAVIGSGAASTVMAVSVMVVPTFARVVRGVAMEVREADFISACKLMGQSDRRIILTHVLPSCLPMLLITFTLNLGTAVLTTSSLSFVGLGLAPPSAEWGAMLHAARHAMRLQPMGIIVPGMAVTLFVMSASLIGDGLRDAFDPRYMGGVFREQ